MISGIVSTFLLVLFIGGWVWAWSPKRKAEFDAAACLPLTENETNYEDRANSAKESSP